MIHLLPHVKKYIYGDGKYGKMLAYFCRMKGISVQAVLISGPVEKSEALYGFAVKTFISEQEYLKGAQVFLAMSRENADACIEELLSCHPLRVDQITIKEYQWLIKELFWNLPVNRNQIFVDCYEGQGYRCNPRAIAQEILARKDKNDPVFKNAHVVWQVNHIPDSTLPKTVSQILMDYSPEYFETLYSSAIIICNDGCLTGSIKRNEQYLLNTWHGTGPFKRMGAAVAAVNDEQKKWFHEEYEKADCLIVAAREFTAMIREAFQYSGPILPLGYPRNDFLMDIEKRNQTCQAIRDKFQISPDRKILLYVPTFRHTGRDGFSMYDLEMPLILKALQTRFGAEFCLIYRYHHAMWKDIANEKKFPAGIDATDYPDIMDLLAAADVLITDYSSCMWDYSLMYRPVFLYHNDVKEYEDDRGFFWPPERWPYPKAHSTEEMCEQILHFDEDAYHKALDKFFEEDPSYDDGHASERVVDLIEDVMVHPEKYGKE